MRRLVALAVLLSGCSGAAPTSPPVVQPTPQIIYVTAPPPTTTVVYVTPAPGTVLPATAAPSASAISTPEAHTISGTLTLRSSTDVWTGQFKCAGKGVSSGIDSGNAVVARDATNVIIGTGILGEGLATGSVPTAVESFHNSATCIFAFTLDVPRSDFYAIQIASVPPYTISYTDLAKAAWHLDLNVGP